VLLHWAVCPVETVLPETRVTTDTSGSFSRELDMYWPKHPSLANLYESNGNTLLLTAHASAPGALPTRRLAALHRSGTGLSAGAAAGLLAWRCCWSPAAGPAGPPPDLVRVGSGQAELLEPPEAVLQ
jgi:hypothetical protein